MRYLYNLMLVLDTYQLCNLHVTDRIPGHHGLIRHRRKHDCKLLVQNLLLQKFHSRQHSLELIGMSVAWMVLSEIHLFLTQQMSRSILSFNDCHDNFFSVRPYIQSDSISTCRTRVRWIPTSAEFSKRALLI